MNLLRRFDKFNTHKITQLVTNQLENMKSDIGDKFIEQLSHILIEISKSFIFSSKGDKRWKLT
jgi:hypothetical protein